MASAVLANRNEPNWTQPQPRGGAKFMGKVPFSNSNPKLSKKRQFQPAQPVVNFDGPPALMQPAASDDASSINRRPPNDFNTGGYLTFNISSYSKKELVELKNRFLAELEQIRKLKSRINSSELQIRSSSNFHSKKPIAAPNNKKILGNKRPFPATNFGFGGKDVKRSNHPEQGSLMKKCVQILSKLMKHKHGYIFNSPVDVEGLQLHDYYDIIKNPMDLGTVKLKMSKNLYESPMDFAADVRLTFTNAMMYNPKGHEVYSLAEQLLSRFEEWFRPIRDKFGEDDLDQGHEQDQVQVQVQVQVQEVQASSWDHNPSRGDIDRVKKDQENVMPIAPKYEQIPKSIPPSASNPQSTSQMPVRTPSPLKAPPVKPLKLPKPKAKDPNKREMSLEEKHKLGIGLQSLPQEKMEQVVQIIRKRNGHLTQDGDEIELDIEAVDTETLWELDRFVTNYKKMVSKIKRQALLGVNNPGAAISDGNKDVSGNERMDVVTEVKKPKKGDAGDEDVDIGDEMPMSSFPPVEIEKDNGHASSSSSSSSSSSDDSSSSSDSDSGSSSGSDSEDAHS
ncbi:transcription factor GTE7-like [Euphorbia lathyris]|uniref:transcription factor GTE7-like n=1 Tax=Euphorbia lathyris TaxID=212925 RepID=UPI0033131AD9